MLSHPSSPHQQNHLMAPLEITLSNTSTILHHPHHSSPTTPTTEDAVSSSSVVISNKRKALVIVDPVSSGAMLSLLAQQRGYTLIALYSNGLEDELIRMIPQRCREEGLRFDYIIKVGKSGR